MPKKTVVDHDNPEWTEEDFAKARPAAEVLPPEVMAAFPKMSKGGRPKAENPKVAISLRLDADVLEAFKAEGAGWQTRVNDALRAHAFPTKKQAEAKARYLAQLSEVASGDGMVKAVGPRGGGAAGKLPASVRSAAAGQVLPVGPTKAAPGSRLKKR